MRRWMTGKVNYRLAVLLLVVLGLVDVLVIAAFWRTPVNVSNDTTFSDRPALAVDTAGTIHMVWSDTLVNYPGNSEILYRSSSDGGQTWGSSAALNLSNSSELSLRPVITTAGNDQRLIAWAEGSDPVVRRWNGSTWLEPFTLSTSVTPTLRISTAINDDGIALVAWSEGYGAIAGYAVDQVPDSQGFYRRWNGSTWEPAQAVAARIVALRGNLAYLATERGELLRSTDAGQTWSAPISLPPTYRPPDDMKLDSIGTLHMAWLSAHGVQTGRYADSSFSLPTAITSWPQIPSAAATAERNALLGAIPALALSVNAVDHVGLVWTAPSLLGSTTAYRPQGVNGLGGEAAYMVMSSQSLDGRTWSAPVMQNVPGGFPALAAAPTGGFYGAWRSPGFNPDVFVAVNETPQPRYEETFDSYAGLFAKGVSIISGTATLNTAQAFAWPLFGLSQNYGVPLRGQAGTDELLLLDTCLTRFQVNTGQVHSYTPTLCVPQYRLSVNSVPRPYTVYDGLVHADHVYLLTSFQAFNPVTFATVTTPSLMLMDTATGTLTELGQPSDLPETLSLTAGQRLAVAPDGSQIYVIFGNQVYRYTVANATWTNLNQMAISLAVDSAGTVYSGWSGSLSRFAGSGAFSEIATDFNTQHLLVDQNDCVIGVGSQQPISARRSDGSQVSAATPLNTLWAGAYGVTTDPAGAIYLINSTATASGTADQVLRYQCTNNSQSVVSELPLLRPQGSNQGLTLAADGHLWLTAREFLQVPDQNPQAEGLLAYDLDNSLRGDLVSVPIFSGSGTMQWGTLTYSVTVPAGGSFALDVLDSDGSVLREDVASGTSLADLPATPLRLRARMQAPNAAAAPILHSWRLDWQRLEQQAATLRPSDPLNLRLADGAINLSFPTGAVSQTTTVTYTEQVSASQALGTFQFAGRSFTIEATDANGTPVTRFSQPFTLTISYDPVTLAAAGINPATLDLVYWNGSAWVSTNPTVDTANQRLVAVLDHLTEFAVVAQPTQTVFLPFIAR